MASSLACISAILACICWACFIMCPGSSCVVLSSSSGVEHRRSRRVLLGVGRHPRLGWSCGVPHRPGHRRRRPASRTVSICAPGNAARMARTSGWIGGRGAAAGIGGAALLGQGRLALGGGQRDGPARAGRLGQQRRRDRAAGRCGASGCGRSSITGGAKRTRCTEWIRCACSIASRCSATSAMTSRKLGRRRRRRRRHRPASAPPPAHRAQRRRHRRSAAARAAPARLAPAPSRQPPHQVARRRQFGDMAQADQHHLGRGAAVRRGLHLADALQQHLPGARQHRHRQLDPPAPRRGCARPPAVLARRAAPARDFSRVSVWVSSSRSCSITPRSAPRSCASSVICSAWRGWPAITASIRSNTRPRSARPSMSTTAASVTGPSACGDRLVEQRQPVAHRAIGGARDQVERGRLDRHRLLPGDAAEMRRQLRDAAPAAGRSAGSATAR